MFEKFYTDLYLREVRSRDKSHIQSINRFASIALFDQRFPTFESESVF